MVSYECVAFFQMHLVRQYSKWCQHDGLAEKSLEQEIVGAARLPYACVHHVPYVRYVLGVGVFVSMCSISCSV